MAEQWVRDIYHKGVIFCKNSTPLQEVVRVMADTDISAIIVSEGEETRPLGVISHIDVIARYGEDLSAITAEEVMTPEVITIGEDASVVEAAQEMLSSDVHRLLVVSEGGTPLGILSTTDIVRNMRGSSWVWYRG